MLSEDRIRLMTRTTILEQNNKSAMRANSYYRKEYVVSHFLVVWIWLTFAFCMLASGAAVLFIEEYPKQAQNADWPLILYTALMLYIILVFVFMIISLLVYSYRYSTYMEIVKQYNNNLKNIDKKLKEEAKQMPVNKTAKETKKAKKKVMNSAENEMKNSGKGEDQ